MIIERLKLASENTKASAEGRLCRVGATGFEPATPTSRTYKAENV